MKTTKKLLSLLISGFLIAVTIGQLAFAETPTQEETTFSDVGRTHLQYTSIMFLYNNGVIGGYEDGTFKAEKAINRAEVLKIILKGSKIDSPETFQDYFPDVKEADWFFPYVIKAKELGFVKGNATDGTFTPGRQVNLAEFLKMLLLANEINVEGLAENSTVEGLEAGQWYTPYINYAVISGVLGSKDDITPSRQLTRGDVANMMYLLTLVRNGNDNQFLLSNAEKELAQVEGYLNVKNTLAAKSASTLAVDLTTKASSNLPDSTVVTGASKIAKSYDYLVNAYTLAISGETTDAAGWANATIQMATEAWEANHETQTIAKHLKDLAREILTQVGGTEA